MNILILGNGFDIAHGLKTKYTDFLNYCKNEEQYKHFCTTNIWMKHFLTRQSELGDTWIDLETEIYEVIKFIQTLPLIDQKNSKKVDEYILLSDIYYKGCMLARDRYMADQADVLLAYCKKETGGAAYTVRYFTKKYPEKEVIFI